MADASPVSAMSDRIKTQIELASRSRVTHWVLFIVFGWGGPVIALLAAFLAFYDRNKDATVAGAIAALFGALSALVDSRKGIERAAQRSDAWESFKFDYESALSSMNDDRSMDAADTTVAQRKFAGSLSQKFDELIQRFR